MKQILALVEGQTEEIFIKNTLHTYLLSSNVSIQSTLITEPQKGARGGLPSYGRVRRTIENLLKNQHIDLVTTMFDFYALKRDFPGFETLPSGTPYQRVSHIVNALQQDIPHRRFLPYISLHEFEALLFTSPKTIAATFDGTTLRELERITSQYNSPEEINEGNPPSKRLLALYPKYDKVIHGFYIADEIGLDRIRQACSHFNEWLTTLEKLGKDDD